MVFEILLGLWGVDRIVKDAQRREWATARARAVVYRDAELFIGFNDSLGWGKFVLKKPLFGNPHWRVRPSMRRAQAPEKEIGAVAAEWLKSQPSDIIDEIRQTTQAELDRSFPWDMLSSKKWAGLFYALNRKAGFPKFYWARNGFFGHKQWRARAYVPYTSA
jgi:hypothetical protein